MNTNVIIIAEQFIELVRKSGITVTDAYLFGSYSKNQAKKHSDIDISIISPTFKGVRQTNRIRLMKISNKVSDLIEPHPMSNDEFLNPYDPFVREVKKGIRLIK